MVRRQLPNVPHHLRLGISDMQRIINNTDDDIFNKTRCSLWNGYVTTTSTSSAYINFWFKGRKISLHRLLFVNYCGTLESNSYLKYICPNKGVCCNLNHFMKCNNHPVQATHQPGAWSGVSQV